MRMIAAFQKTHELSYTSHLDVQRTLQRAFRRAQLPLSYSKGFNPHPKLSFSTALATGCTGDAEWFEVELEQEILPAAFIERTNAVMPNGMRITQAFEADDGIDTLSKLIRAAAYCITLHLDTPASSDAVQAALDAMLAEHEIVVDKKTKSGTKPTNIRPDILEASLMDVSGNIIRLHVVGLLTVHGGLRVETFVNALLDRLHANGFATTHRTALYFEGSDRLPRLP